MDQKLQNVRGTRDILGPDMLLHNSVLKCAKDFATLYCYEEIFTPIFEYTNVFHRTLGESSDIVSKETYTFTDRDKSLLTLRPEFTAGIVRAIVSNGMLQSLPLKLFSHGPVFRHERPQRCRYRQFNQINFEFFGPNNPNADVEVICLANDILNKLGLAHLINLEINTIGDIESRRNYSEILSIYLNKHKNSLSAESLARLDKNPLRILDSKNEIDKEILKDAPSIKNYLSNDSALYYEKFIKKLDSLQLKYTHNDKLVRGLDYYTHTVFEFTTSNLGSQGTVLAGGRYNGLVELMSGINIPGIGFAAGIERLVEMMKINQFDKLDIKKRIDLIPIGEIAEQKAQHIAKILRNNNIATYLLYDANLKKRMQFANKNNAIAAIIFGENEINNQSYQVKNMKTGEQTIINEDKLVNFLTELLSICSKIDQGNMAFE